MERMLNMAHQVEKKGDCLMKDTTDLRGRLADGIHESTFFVGYLNCAKKILVSPVALARSGGIAP